MSTADATLRLILLGDDKTASKSLKGVGGQTDKTSKKMQTFHKVGTAAGVALAGGLLLAGKAALDMTKKAAEDEQAASKLANTIHKTTGATKTQTNAVEDWITAQGKATGVTDDELRPALSKLVVATHSVSKAQHLAKLAQDVSIGTGKSLESVSFALAKAQNGNVTGLSRLGIATKDADGKTKSLHAITKDLANTYGGAATKNAETAAGKQKILTTQMGELQEKIGAGLLPVMGKLVDIGMKVVDWISNNTRLAGTLVGVMGGLLAVTWGVSAAIKAWSAITKIAAAAQWLLNAAMSANPIMLVVVVIAALVVALVIAYKKSETFRNIVNAAFHAVQSVVGAVVGFIKDHWKTLFVALTGPVGLAVLFIVKNFDKVKGAIQAVGAVGRWLWNSVFQPVFKFIVQGVASVLNMWGNMLDALKHVPGFGWVGAIADKLHGAADKANALANAIRDIPDSKSVAVVINVVQGVVHTTGGHVPKMAKGGIVRRPTLALIGEAGPEAVVPLSKGAPHGMAGMGATTVTINVNVPVGADKGAAGKEMVTALKAYERISGVRVLA